MIFILGILNFLDGFIVFILFIGMLTISAFYKGSHSWIIMTGLLFSGMVTLLMTVAGYADGFLGFFIFLYLYILAGANYITNKEDLTNRDLDGTIKSGKKVCEECGEKMKLNDIFCGNCGHKMSK
jgi:hypothetical protein